CVREGRYSDWYLDLW
nr:immunoglobulin heavy chain junction region [Macaca mulatta]